ncbi:TPA: response regulator [Candidatus Delongbacteria bacterium]|nr:response regulator [Candidatus Delongbacteria bacterium]
MAKILVVEDDKNNMRLITKLLDQEGHKIVKAETGEDGVKLAMEDPPDIILMDIKLPGIDGLEATKKIRESCANDAVTIIALTSYAMAGDREKYLKCGFTGYIEKPIDPYTVIKEIKEIWEKNIMS